jgi:hypothetical protein
MDMNHTTYEGHVSNLRHRTSWGILPQTPVFSLRSALSHWYSSNNCLCWNIQANGPSEASPPGGGLGDLMIWGSREAGSGKIV